MTLKVTSAVRNLSNLLARNSSDGNAIRYVLPVFMDDMFYTMQGMDPNQRRCVCFVQFARRLHFLSRYHKFNFYNKINIFCCSLCI